MAQSPKFVVQIGLGVTIECNDVESLRDAVSVAREPTSQEGNRAVPTAERGTCVDLALQDRFDLLIEGMRDKPMGRLITALHQAGRDGLNYREIRKKVGLASLRSVGTTAGGVVRLARSLKIDPDQVVLRTYDKDTQEVSLLLPRGFAAYLAQRSS